MNVRWERYRKIIVFVIGAVVAITAILWPDNTKLADIIAAITLGLTGLGVYQIPNEPMPKVVGDDPNTGWAEGGKAGY
jgi:hypothetical protein